MDISRLRDIGRKGGLARTALHGNFGTLEGRKKGGRNSILSHTKNKTGFKILKTITIPRHSVRLAELLGILMGDGHVGKYQVSMVTNSKTDLQHALLAKNLIEDLFGIQAHLSNRSSREACDVVASSKAMCSFFVEQGIPQGNKISLGIHIPSWVQEKSAYRQALIRGLFDTDGCVYVDTHRVGKKVYENMGMAFANHSLPLLSFFKESLELFGFHPTQKTRFRVFLRRKEDIKGYFRLIGTSNEKHLGKFKEYLLGSEGGVA